MSKADYTVAGLKAAPGSKVQGFLEVPGTPVRMPITLVNGAEPGPTVLITGGVHGGEYPGIEAAIRLAAELNPARVKGQVAVIHIVSPLAFQARQQYVVPQDGKNPNRQFPGSALGTVTERMAHTIMTQVVPGLDAWVDLHGGDIHEALVPFTIYSDASAPEVQAKSKAMAEVYGIKYVVARNSVAGGTYGAASSAGVPCILTEAGQCGQLDEANTLVHLNGCRNVLKHLGVLPGSPEPVAPIALLRDFPWVRSEQDGCAYPSVKVGDVVTAGQPVAVVKDYFGNVLGEYQAPASGVVLFAVTSLAIGAGDPILAVGVE
jgi:predicted deacylase